MNERLDENVMVSPVTDAEKSLALPLLLSLMDNNPAPFLIVGFDGRIQITNHAALRILGSDPIGHQIIEVLPNADFSIWRNQDAGESVQFEQELPSGIYLFTVATEPSGKIHFVFGNDITERISREEEFERTIANYVAMINTVPAMTYLKDIEGRYVIANATFCAYMHMDLQELMGKHDDDLPDQYENTKQNESELQVMKTGETITKQEKSSVDSDGRVRWTTTTIVPVYDECGQVGGVVGLIQDVTELHDSRERLIQADKMSAIGTLSAGVAHEINNPVGFINSNLNTMGKYLKKIRGYLEGNSQPDAEAWDVLAEMLDDFGDAIRESMDGTDRVKKIVADLKSFSRVDKAQKTLYNLNEGLDTTLNIVWNELKYKCTVEKNYSDIPNLYCIPNQLNQVFMNLLVNAGQAIQKDSGRITITTSSDNENIYVSISDTGVGISPETMKKIFEPFYTTKEVGKGTGLGLSMAYDIIKKHFGRIDVTSEVGSGTEFTLTLPLEGLKPSDTQSSIG